MPELVENERRDERFGRIRESRDANLSRVAAKEVTHLPNRRPACDAGQQFGDEREDHSRVTTARVLGGCASGPSPHSKAKRSALRDPARVGGHTSPWALSFLVPQ